LNEDAIVAISRIITAKWPVAIRETANQLNISGANPIIRRDAINHHTKKTVEYITAKAPEYLQTLWGGAPAFINNSGSIDKNIAPKANASKTRNRYFCTLVSGPGFFRNATTRPLKPAKAILISLIVCSNCGISINRQLGYARNRTRESSLLPTSQVSRRAIDLSCPMSRLGHYQPLIIHLVEGLLSRVFQPLDRALSKIAEFSVCFTRYRPFTGKCARGWSQLEAAEMKSHLLSILKPRFCSCN